MSEKVKKQHYVPQFYLRYFATPETAHFEGNDRARMRIHACKKEGGKRLVNQLIANVAAENYFYDLPNDDEQMIEKWLGRDVEARVGPIYKSVVDSETTNALAYSDMHTLALFLAIQYHRTRKFRDSQMKVLQKFLDAAQDHPEHFKDFVKENSQYTVPDIEAMLSRRRVDIATRRLEAFRLPPDQRTERIAELNREFELFDKVSTDIERSLKSYSQGKISDELLQIMSYLSENPSLRQAQSMRASVPKLAQRLLSMEWSVHKYSQNTFRFTSDSPLLTFPTAVPASKNDWEALSLYSMTYLGQVRFYIDEIVEDYPPMIFIFPLTPHLDLFITPVKAAPMGEDQGVADAWNLPQVVQAHQFVFSAKNDFSTVPEAVEEYLTHKKIIEQRIPARMEDEPHLNKREPRHKRWVRP